MSVLVRNYDYIYVGCGMDYGKHVRDSVNYVPCTVRGKSLGKVLGVFRNYLNKHEVFRCGKRGPRPRDANNHTKQGKPVGEVLDSLIHLIIGIRYCIKYLSSTK
jgi:hypothetical protein